MYLNTGHRESHLSFRVAHQKQRYRSHNWSRLCSCTCSCSSPEKPEREHKSIFLFGSGYTSLALTGVLRSRGWTVHGTYRTRKKEEELTNCGIVPHLFEPAEGAGLDGFAKEALVASSAILSTIPPLSSSTSPSDGRTSDLTARFLCQLDEELPCLDWLGYVSTTGVYGDWRGEWVTEFSIPKSETPRGQARISAEEDWRRLEALREYPLHIFRAGGIYGPLRNVLQSKAKLENAQRRQREAYVSRIHVSDLVQILIKSIENPQPGACYHLFPISISQDTNSSSCPGIYNAVDDCPSTRDAVTNFSLKLKGKSKSETSNVATAVGEKDNETVSPSPVAADKGKRVSNQKVKSDLGVNFEFPSYIEGMKAIIEGDIRPFDDQLLRAYMSK